MRVGLHSEHGRAEESWTDTNWRLLSMTNQIANRPGDAVSGPIDPRRIRVLLVDDHPAVRGGVRKLIDDQPDMVVVGGASSATELLGAAGLSADVCDSGLPPGRPERLVVDPPSEGARAPPSCSDLLGVCRQSAGSGTGTATAGRSRGRCCSPATLATWSGSIRSTRVSARSTRSSTRSNGRNRPRTSA